MLTQPSGILQYNTRDVPSPFYVLTFYTLSFLGSALGGCSFPKHHGVGLECWCAGGQEFPAEGSGQAGFMASGVRVNKAKAWVLPLDHSNPRQSYSLWGEWLENVLEQQPQNSISSLPFVCLSLSNFLRNGSFLLNMCLSGCTIMLHSKAN